MDKLSIVKKQFETLKNDERIVAVVLFGSYASNTGKPLSDIDICIITAKGISMETAIRITPCVGADVSYFYNLPLHMRRKVISEGKAILINDAAAFSEAKSRSILGYLDFNPLRERLINSMLARGVF